MDTLLKKYKPLNLTAFVVANQAGWGQVEKNLADFPFDVKIIDPANYRGQDFTREMIELNEAAYGKGMAAPSWTFANFGTIGAGITGGFFSAGVPVSKFSMVGNVMDPTISHEWTLLVHPDFQGKGLASLTVAMALQTVSHMKYHTFIAQTDNSSINVYLKAPNPLHLLAYGFVHTRRNSLLIKTAIPDTPFLSFMENKPVSLALADFPLVTGGLPAEKIFWVQEGNHQLFLDVNEAILAGATFILKGRVESEGKVYLLLQRL